MNSQLTQSQGDLFPTVVAKFLRTIIDLESIVEREKIALLENHLFNPFVAFQYFDRFGQGYATKADMRAMFAKYDVQVSEQDLDYLIYYKGGYGKFKPSLSRPDCFFYDNFLNLISPANSKKLADNLASRKDLHAGKAHLLPNYVFDQFLDYLRRELKTLNSLQSIRVEMINLYGYTANLDLALNFAP